MRKIQKNSPAIRAATPSRKSIAPLLEEKASEALSARAELRNTVLCALDRAVASTNRSLEYAGRSAEYGRQHAIARKEISKLFSSRNFHPISVKIVLASINTFTLAEIEGYGTLRGTAKCINHLFRMDAAFQPAIARSLKIIYEKTDHLEHPIPGLDHQSRYLIPALNFLLALSKRKGVSPADFSEKAAQDIASLANATTSYQWKASAMVRYILGAKSFDPATDFGILARTHSRVDERLKEIQAQMPEKDQLPFLNPDAIHMRIYGSVSDPNPSARHGRFTPGIIHGKGFSIEMLNYGLVESALKEYFGEYALRYFPPSS